MANKFLIVCGGSGVCLLGQRRVLGVNAELQIDVSKECIPTKDPQSLRVMLDRPVGTIPLLLLEMKSKIVKGSAHPRDVAHANFVARHMVAGGDLIDGLAQSPVIGGGTIRYPDNEADLREKLSTMITQFAQNIGPANPLDVWIISSTAGGTGEGSHRFVGTCQ